MNKVFCNHCAQLSKFFWIFLYHYMPFIFIENALSERKQKQNIYKYRYFSIPACIIIKTKTYIVYLGVECRFKEQRLTCHPLVFR